MTQHGIVTHEARHNLCWVVGHVVLNGQGRQEHLVLSDAGGFASVRGLVLRLPHARRDAHTQQRGGLARRVGRHMAHCCWVPTLQVAQRLLDSERQQRVPPQELAHHLAVLAMPTNAKVNTARSVHMQRHQVVPRPASRQDCILYSLQCHHCQRLGLELGLLCGLAGMQSEAQGLQLLCRHIPVMDTRGAIGSTGGAGQHGGLWKGVGGANKAWRTGLLLLKRGLLPGLPATARPCAPCCCCCRCC
mmetsp:Transcript_8841/g.23825  ORF Transcript_8841/g.23825 Transcript_8841/m.23825 type:complete len:246 (-) Transcript_8841:402-1139(-)